MTNKAHQCRAGFTLTEIAIVLAIVGIIMGAIWAAAKSVSDGNMADQATQDIMTIANNIRSTYLSANSFTATGDQTTNLMNVGGIFPADLLVGNPATAVRNAWNGAVKVTFSPSNSNIPSANLPRFFRVTFQGTPPDACFRIAAALANLGTTDAPAYLITAGSNIVAIPNSGANVGLSTTVLNNQCQLNKTLVNASTEFDFTIH